MHQSHWSKQLRRTSLIVFAGTALLVTLIASCDAYKWPPYEDQLRTMLVESKSVLTEIESEMMADGLSVVGPNPLRRHGEPELTDAQLRKYKDLFEQLPYYGTFFRDDRNTTVSLLGASPIGLGKEFSFSFVHGEIPEGLPSCDAGGRTVSCGACDVDLGDNWHLQYQWLPKDIGPDWDGKVGEGLPTMEEIQEQHQREIEECFEAWRIEMGIDPDTE